MQTKRIHVELKAETPGALKAVFATFGVVDNDGDVTLAGAFEVGQKVPIAGVGHNWDIPTIGGGTVYADENSAWVDGMLNLEMISAQEHWKSIKFDVDQEINRQEYSYAYDVLKGHSARPDEIKKWPGAKRILEQLAVHEVSPVLLGAGIGTGTLLVKAHKALKEGRVLSQIESMKTSIDELEALLAETEGAPKSLLTDSARFDTAILRSAHNASKARLYRVFGAQIN